MKNSEAFELYNEWVSSKDYWIKKISALAFSNEVVSDDDLNAIIDDYVNNSFLTFQYDLPQENNSSIILRSVDNISGVNRLLSDQILEFDENLTLIYGDNGVGKTGYSRIFQQLGKTIEKSIRPIKSNVLITPIIPNHTTFVILSQSITLLSMSAFIEIYIEKHLIWSGYIIAASQIKCRVEVGSLNSGID